MILTIVLIFVVAIIAVIFALANPAMVHLSLFGFAVDGQVGLFLLISLGVGILLGILLMAPSLISRSFVTARQRRRIAELEVMPKEPASKVSKSQMVPPSEPALMDMPPTESKPKDPAA